MVDTRKVQVCDSPVGILQHQTNPNRANPAFFQLPRIHATFSPVPNKQKIARIFLSDAFRIPREPVESNSAALRDKSGKRPSANFNNIVI